MRTGRHQLGAAGYQVDDKVGIITLNRPEKLNAISCELQVVGSEDPVPHDEPGYRASIETIGDIDPLDVPGPLAR